MEETVINL